MNRIAKFSVGPMMLSVVMLSAVMILAGATTAPSTKPAPIKPTTQQVAFLDKIRAEPLDEPCPKYDVRRVDANGKPNENFGRLDQHFVDRHEALLKLAKAGPIDLLFLGDSITEGWAGRGAKIWAERYQKLNAANFGISGDRTEHVLWRIANGELDGVSPKVVVLLIGTNNMGATPEKIAAADVKIVDQIHAKLPDTKVLVLGIFPRGFDPAKDWVVKSLRHKVEGVNAVLAKLDDKNKTRFLDIGDKFLPADGIITPDIMPDALHPSAKGYQIWADAMQPMLDEMMK